MGGREVCRHLRAKSMAAPHRLTADPPPILDMHDGRVQIGMHVQWWIECFWALKGAIEWFGWTMGGWSRSLRGEVENRKKASDAT